MRVEVENKNFIFANLFEAKIRELKLSAEIHDKGKLIADLDRDLKWYQETFETHDKCKRIAVLERDLKWYRESFEDKATLLKIVTKTLGDIERDRDDKADQLATMKAKLSKLEEAMQLVNIKEKVNNLEEAIHDLECEIIYSAEEIAHQATGMSACSSEGGGEKGGGCLSFRPSGGGSHAPSGGAERDVPAPSGDAYQVTGGEKGCGCFTSGGAERDVPAPSGDAYQVTGMSACSEGGGEKGGGCSSFRPSDGGCDGGSIPGAPSGGAEGDVPAPLQPVNDRGAADTYLDTITSSCDEGTFTFRLHS